MSEFIITNTDVDNSLSIYIGTNNTIILPANGSIDMFLNYSLSEIKDTDIPYHIEQDNIMITHNGESISKLNALKLIWSEIQPLQTDSASGKNVVQNSAKPIINNKHFYMIWVGAGDDINDANLTEGPLINIETEVGITVSTFDVEFLNNVDESDIYLHEGYLAWDAAGWGDYVTVDIVGKATVLQTIIDLDYEITETVKIKYATAGAGTGTHGLGSTPTFIPNTTNTGYWDLDATLTPIYRSDQTGAYDWYTIDIPVHRFVNKIPIYDKSYGYVRLNSSDTTKLPPGYLIRYNVNNTSNTVFKIWSFLTVFREKTL